MDKKKLFQREKWYESWFDSKYYHILYKHRTFDEAQKFIEKITQYLEMKPGSLVLDLACGKGRHSIHLNKLGYDVTGVDLSEESIVDARHFENDKLAFYTHDMRQPFRINYYDYIFNLFTSFGYFDDEVDDLNVFRGVVKGLKKDGIFVFDFLNIHKVLDHLVTAETKEIDGILFNIKRRFENGFIFKDISFSDQDHEYSFTERVRGFNKEDIVRLLSKAGLKPIHFFGDYALNKFDEKTASRLIIIARKNGNN